MAEKPPTMTDLMVPPESIYFSPSELEEIQALSVANEELQRDYQRDCSQEAAQPTLNEK